MNGDSEQLKPIVALDTKLKVCDHTSVGMLVWKAGNLLMIERKRFPFGYAPPAGHVDGDVSFENAAIRELSEEVGLTAINLQLVAEADMDNQCRRIDGSWHHWCVYQVVFDEKQEIQTSFLEVKQVKWCTLQQIKIMAERTKQFLDQKISEEEWKKSPGLEVVWYQWFQRLKVI